MNRHARIVDGLVAEILTIPDGFAVAECFPAAIAAALVPCGDDVTGGMTWDGIAFGPVPGKGAEQLWIDLRHERDARLAASDIMVMADRWNWYDDATRNAWAAYRKALRDLPEVTADPAAPTWPDVPGA